jgi:PAS domain S-box-containing protein
MGVAPHPEVKGAPVLRQRWDSGPALATPALLAAALEAAATPALVIAMDGTIVHANRALLAWTGHAAAELTGRRSQVLFSSGCALADFRPVREALGRGLAWAGEASFLGKDGKAYRREVRAAPVRDASGAITHALALCQDLTERRQQQERLLLTDRMVSIGTLAAGVAHEINNPLAFLLANMAYAADVLAQLAQGEPALADVRAAIGEAREGAERVRDIVRDLKTFSRGDDGARALIDLERVMESSIKLAWNAIRHRARLVRQYGRVPRVEAEEARLGQVFLNLILNAVQAIPEGAVQENEIRVVTRVDEDGRVVAEVQDSGEGISESVRSRLFEPFFTTKPVGVGTGLGLYICHDIITALGGEIEVESGRGKGSLFRVVLPAPARPQPRGLPATVAAGLSPRGRVLVVDDEPMIAATLTRVLSMHEVIAVRTARDALARITAGESFDVILCDLVMPEMNGMALHAELAERAPEAARRMVFLTGDVCTQQARAFAGSVPNPLIEKPFDATALRALVAQRLKEPPP